MRKTSVAVDVEVSKLLKAIAAKRGKQLGLSITKGEILRNIVVAEARSLGLYPKATSR